MFVLFWLPAKLPKIYRTDKRHIILKICTCNRIITKDFAKAELPDEKGRIAFQIGESYEYNNNYKSAAEWYYKASDLNYGSDAILRYAYMLKAQEKYIDAIKEFEKYLNEEPYRRPEITIELNASKQALTWMSNQNDEYERDTYVTNLTALNSADADFNPVLYKQDQVLITSSRTASSGEKTDTWTNDKFYDLFISQIKDINTFTAPKNLKDRLIRNTMMELLPLIKILRKFILQGAEVGIKNR